VSVLYYTQVQKEKIIGRISSTVIYKVGRRTTTEGKTPYLV